MKVRLSLRLALLCLALLSAGPALAQAPEPNDRIVNAESPIVSGNAVAAKQRAMTDAFRQAVDRAYTSLLKEYGDTPRPEPIGLAQLRASFATRGQRFIRTYRVLEQGESDGRFLVQLDAEVDMPLLRRELERARGGVAATAAAPAAVPQGPALVAVGGEIPAELGTVLVKALLAAGAKAQLVSGSDEGQVLSAAGKLGAGSVLVIRASLDTGGNVRGTAEVSASCQVRARLLRTGASTEKPVLERSDEGYGFGASESAARAACWSQMASNLAHQTAVAVGPAAHVAARFVTLDLEMNDPSAVYFVVQALKRMGGVTATEVRQVTPRRAEIRMFTPLGGPALGAGLGRELANRVVVDAVKPSDDRVLLQVRPLDSGEAQPAAGAETPAPR